MFDAVGAFTKQFTPVEGGFLLYTSAKSGGKLVTVEEYDRLVADWGSVAGRAGRWKVAGIVTVALALGVLLSEAASLPHWADTLMIAATVVAISAWLFWASFAPRRLVENRPVVAPPRPASEARRDARAALNWPFVLFALLLSGTTFFGTVNASDRTLTTWAWLLGSGLMFGAYVWIGFRKLMDGRR